MRRPYAAHPFDGEGAFRYGGRWSSVGTRISYTAEHLSLAMVEYFVHLDADDLPDDLVLARAEIPDSVSRHTIGIEQLPSDWRHTPPPAVLADIGDTFVREGKAAILIVPSVIAPTESNWLLNPAHADFAKIRIPEVEPFAYDLRFSKTTQVSGKCMA